jgi:hypothetical protein
MRKCKLPFTYACRRLQKTSVHSLAIVNQWLHLSAVAKSLMLLSLPLSSFVGVDSELVNFQNRYRDFGEGNPIAEKKLQISVELSVDFRFQTK